MDDLFCLGELALLKQRAESLQQSVNWRHVLADLLHLSYTSLNLLNPASDLRRKPARGTTRWSAHDFRPRARILQLLLRAGITFANKDFHRLRIGIGHPGHASKVTGYVLGAPSQVDRTRIDACIDEAIAALPLALDGDTTKAMTRLHSFSAA